MNALHWKKQVREKKREKDRYKFYDEMSSLKDKVELIVRRYPLISIVIFIHNHSRGRSIHPFCSKVKRDPLQTECTDDRNSVALCNLIRHDYPLPKMYQNFDYISNVKEGEEEYYGGSVTLADFCPFIQEFTWRSKNVIVRGSQCQFEENNPSKIIQMFEGVKTKSDHNHR